MKLFSCQKCGQLLYFENTHCERCRSPLGFWPERMDLLTLVSHSDASWSEHGGSTGRYRYCRNAEYQACNWLIRMDDSSDYCQACQLNRTVPDLASEANRRLWRKMEVAKHRLVYSLLRQRLPAVSQHQDPNGGLAFDFLEDETLPSGEKQRVITGHANGLITINISEADDTQRVQMRQSMGERYRTLLGHFRHEVGHYYWNTIVLGTPYLDAFRRLFGDERTDYGEALQRHYATGAPADWSQRYISAYASSHPWEDWAETWAHYLHMIDTLATSYAFGLRVAPRVDAPRVDSPRFARDESLVASVDQDPYRIPDFDHLYEQWLPLTTAVNSINRSMGQPDLYPFVVPPPVVTKLKYVHTVCQAAAVT